MKKASVVGIGLVGLALFILSVPMFYRMSQFGPFVYYNGKQGPNAVGYVSLACAWFGYGDAYWTGYVTLAPDQSPVKGLVYSCQAPLPVA